MRRSELIFAAASFAFSLFAQATSAHSAFLATYVASNGTDASSCAITAPCKTFKYAVTQTTNGGVLTVLTPGSYGAMSITRTMTIVADGVTASIQSTMACPGGGTAAICISGTGTTVHLRGLTIEISRAGAADGIRFNSGSELHVQNSLIRGADGNGINFAPGTASNSLFVSDSTVSDCVSFAISVRPTGSGIYNATIVRVHAEGNQGGIDVDGDVSAAAIIRSLVRETTVGGSNFTGIYVQKTAAGGSVDVMIERSAIVNETAAINSIGLRSIGPGAAVRLGSSTVSGYATGLSAETGGQIYSFGNNQIGGNTTDGSAPTPILLK